MVRMLRRWPSLSPTDNLSPHDVQRGLRGLIKDGAASQAMTVLTGGAFLAAFAVGLGASSFLIGVLAALPPLAQFFQIPSLALVERVRNRRAVTVYASAAARSLWLLVALSPLFLAPQTALAVLVVTLFVQGILASAASTAWNSWTRDLVPGQELASFFSRRLAVATAVGVVLSLGAAFLLDLWQVRFPEREMVGFTLLFGAGCLAGLMGSFFLARIPEPRMPAEAPAPLWATLRRPFKDENFRRLIVFSGAWSFAASLAAPFFVVYMLIHLELPLGVIMALSVVSQLSSIFFLRIWARLADRTSNKTVLATASPMFLLCLLAWTFTTVPGRHVLTLPMLAVIHFLLGAANAGINLASGNIGFRLAPQGRATAYLVARNMTNSIAAGVAPLLGGALADFFALREFSVTVGWHSPDRELAFVAMSLSALDFLFIIALLVGLYALHRLGGVVEEGTLAERVRLPEFLTEVRRDLRPLSTMGGLWQMTQMPLVLLRSSRARRTDGRTAGDKPPEDQGPMPSGSST